MCSQAFRPLPRYPKRLPTRTPWPRAGRTTSPSTSLSGAGFYSTASRTASSPCTRSSSPISWAPSASSRTWCCPCRAGLLVRRPATAADPPPPPPAADHARNRARRAAARHDQRRGVRRNERRQPAQPRRRVSRPPERRNAAALMNCALPPPAAAFATCRRDRRDDQIRSRDHSRRRLQPP